MEMKAQTIDSVQVMSLHGRFDAHEIGRVNDWLARAAEKAPAKVLFDLGGVHFLDSAALSLLVTGMKRCRQQGGDLRLCNLQPPVRIIFELTQLNRALGIHTTLNAAIEAFRNPE